MVRSSRTKEPSHMATFDTLQPRPTGRSTRAKVAGGIAAFALVGLVVAAGAGFWYLFMRSTPAAVSLGEATGATSAPVASAAGASTAPAAAGLEGTWTIDPGVGSFADFSGSFVGYRVQEELANIGAAEAVGRTPDVTGSLTLSGSTITAASITADLTTLQSDKPMRDGQLSRQALETATYPEATFVLTQPIELGSVPADGGTFQATATGDLTIHGQTRSVQIPLQAKLSNGVVTVVGSLDVAFADYGMASPQSMMVLSVADHGVMELQLHFTRS
jgi:polyisoprenoid-binding protein YceI